MRPGRGFLHQRRRLAVCGGGRSGFLRLRTCSFARRRDLGLRSRNRRCLLAIGNQQRDRTVHGDMLGAFGNKNSAEPSVLGHLDFHRRLIGLDFGDNVAGAHVIALAHEPLGERALLHGGRKLRHKDFSRHQAVARDLKSRSRRCRVRMSRVRDRSGQTPRLRSRWRALRCRSPSILFRWRGLPQATDRATARSGHDAHGSP